MVPIDYSLCEREPIHIPGLIQPHGWALSFEVDSWRISGVSANIASKAAIGTSLRELLGDEVCMMLEQWLTKPQTRKHMGYALRLSALADEMLDMIVTRSGDELLLECVPSSASQEHVCMQTLLGHSAQMISAAPTIETMCQRAVEELRRFNGYERVMVYRFDAEYNGCVIAESRDAEAGSYLGLNFPASDIPAQARELFRKNSIRVIADAYHHPVDFWRGGTLGPLDMTYSYLRGVSPVHIEYMHNMGVCSSMTVSLLVEGRLWGLIACHNSVAFSPSMRQVAMAETFGEIFSALLQARIEMQQQKRKAELHVRLETLSEYMQRGSLHPSFVASAIHHAGLFASLFPADGFVVCAHDAFYAQGLEVGREEIDALIGFIEPHLEQGYWHTSSLHALLPYLPTRYHEQFAGMMLIHTRKPESIYWLWIRREQSLTLTWGGNPNEKGFLNARGGISPRTSFEAYRETVRYTASDWVKVEIEFAPLFAVTMEHAAQSFEAQFTTRLQQAQIAALEEEKHRHYTELLEGLIELIEGRDAYTAGHTRRVANYCDIIAEAMELDRSTRALLHEAAVLHDIGKVTVPDVILLKPGRLSQEEYQLIQEHVMTGFRMLHKIAYFRPLAQIIRQHHEKYDGSGYPDGLKGGEISLPAQIMMVCDAIDAMTTNRIYQPRRSMREAIDEIIKYRGVWYHPNVVDAAASALHLLAGDQLSSQLPLTPMEHARLAYFFKDPLTGAYNEVYLKMLLLDPPAQQPFKQLVLLEIKGMGAYNQRFGWKAGSRKIREIALHVYEWMQPEKVFRIHGDDFVLAFDDLDSALGVMRQFLFDEPDLRVTLCLVEASNLIEILE
ncbi:MAG: HD domain-containing protein [Campylobacterales bacterium]|nr:HD domain-containing protein [Campylobacterales bacterium]